MSLHDGIRDESGGDLTATKPAAVEALYRFFGRFDGIELHVNFSL